MSPSAPPSLLLVDDEEANRLIFGKALGDRLQQVTGELQGMAGGT